MGLSGRAETREREAGPATAMGYGPLCCSKHGQERPTRKCERTLANHLLAEYRMWQAEQEQMLVK